MRATSVLTHTTRATLNGAHLNIVVGLCKSGESFTHGGLELVDGGMHLLQFLCRLTWGCQPGEDDILAKQQTKHKPIKHYNSVNNN